MAELEFILAPMESGKSLDLLKVEYNLKQKGRNVIILAPSTDDRNGIGKVSTRIGLSSEAIVISPDDNIINIIKKKMPLDNILVDECQFFTAEHIDQLSDIVDYYDISVTCYGLRSDYKTGALFPGSERLLGICDSIKELETICHCGKKAVMNALFIDGVIQKEGEQVVIEREGVHYESLCRFHWKEGIGCKKNMSTTEKKNQKNIFSFLEKLLKYME